MAILNDCTFYSISQKKTSTIGKCMIHLFLFSNIQKCTTEPSISITCADVTNCLTTDDVSEIYTLNPKFLILTIKYIIKFTNQCWGLQLHIRYSKRNRNPRASSLTSRNMPFKLVLMSMCMMHRRDPDLIMTVCSRSCTRRRIDEHT